MRAIHEHWNITSELRTLWISVVERFTDAVSAELDRERAAGIAPPGAGSRQIAAALLWGTERCLYVAGRQPLRRIFRGRARQARDGG